MIWASLFSVGIAQGLFLIFLIARSRFKNRLASRLMISMVALIVLTNLGYLTARTTLRFYSPQLFGLPFGTVFLFGPLLYFYSRSVSDSTFEWRSAYWLHFIPYLIQLLINLPSFFLGRNEWGWFISAFLQGNLAIRPEEKAIFLIQDLHLFSYLLLVFQQIRISKDDHVDVHFIIPLAARLKWLRELAYCFLFFLIACFSLYIIIMARGIYNPVTNYIYTIASSGIIYFVAYRLALAPGLVSPGFAQKYRAYMRFAGGDGERYLQKLKSLMTESKVFTDPDLKLATLAEQLGLPSHQASKLINEKFGKSYNDFVNGYRVAEFIERISGTDFSSYSIYGIALDVGFNSKSSFNAAFRKATGKTPSDFKKRP